MPSYCIAAMAESIGLTGQPKRVAEKVKIKVRASTRVVTSLFGKNIALNPPGTIPNAVLYRLSE